MAAPGMGVCSPEGRESDRDAERETKKKAHLALARREQLRGLAEELEAKAIKLGLIEKKGDARFYIEFARFLMTEVLEGEVGFYPHPLST